MNKKIATQFADDPCHTPTVFTHNHRRLHALLLENDVWLRAYDLGRLMGYPLDERGLRKLDPDQHRVVRLQKLGDSLMVSESGAYALLVYHAGAHTRQVREWLTQNVAPTLRDANHLGHGERPTQGLLDWAGDSLSLLHWQNEPWIRLRDMPNVLLHETRQSLERQRPWWKRASGFLQI
jgi:prophage antirepressor-like protein